MSGQAFISPDVYKINSDGTNPKLFTRGVGDRPAFSPDGKKVVYPDVIAISGGTSQQILKQMLMVHHQNRLQV